MAVKETTFTLTEIEAVVLTLAYIDALEELAQLVGLAVRDVFEGLAHVDRADIEEFITEASPYTTAGATEAADLASAYLSEMTGQAIAPSDLIAPVVDFEGPFLRTWHQLKEGAPWEEARVSGSSVAEVTGYDVTLDGASARMGQPGVKVRGWRRVINASACEWCQVVATQLYRTQESATFGHHGCRCTTVAVPYGVDATAAINKARLAELKKAGAVERVSAARERSRRR